MTMKISATTDQPVEMATDTTRIDFIDKARQGIEGALSQNDQALVKRLQTAINLMKPPYQGQAEWLCTK
ncbi:hypothetical protein CKO36_13845 [Rhabdochromatium marinum]|nr:hypothetical protein [Rhabdochromatium marinum]